MHVAILERWQGDQTFNLLFQAEGHRKHECTNTLERLQRDAYKNKTPVEYKMIELDGEIVLPKQAPLGDASSRQPERKIIIPNGDYKGMEIYLERDIRED